MPNSYQELVVATFLTKGQQDHVYRALSGHAEILAAQSWAELVAFVRTRPVTVVILNPAADGRTDIRPAVDLLRKHPSVSVMMYVMLNPASFRASIRLHKHGLEGVILQSIDDSSAQLKATIDEVGYNPTLRYVLRILQPGLSRLTFELGTTVESLFLTPHKYNAAHDLAKKAGISTLRLYREFQQARLASPKKLIIAAKLLHACRYLHDADQSVAVVAKKVGYASQRILVQHSLQVFGVTPAAFRSDLGLTMFHRKMICWLTPGDKRTDKRDTPRYNQRKRRKRLSSQAIV